MQAKNASFFTISIFLQCFNVLSFFVVVFSYQPVVILPTLNVNQPYNYLDPQKFYKQV